jgi:hypothetical protein
VLVKGKKMMMLDMVENTYNPSTWELKEEVGFVFEASLDYVVRLCLKK